MARRFLYIVAAVIVLVLAGAIVANLYPYQLIRFSLTPRVAFAPMADATAPDYTGPQGWLARPGRVTDPTRFTPPGIPPATGAGAAVFYVSPTTYLGRDRWNGPLDDGTASYRLRLFASSQASAFNGVGAIWAPRYRQASIGAFLTPGADAARALDFAYADVARAFDAFLAQAPAHAPIILAGHSQGTLHLLRLMREKVAGRPVARRIAAAYLVGWPIAAADVRRLGLPACATAAQAGCILSWESFAEPLDPRLMADYLGLVRAAAGGPPPGSRLLCTNPLTGVPDSAAPAAANRGALVPRAGLAGATLHPGLVPARCDASGILLIGDPPAGYDSYVLPGRNYHVFDYALFWADIRADAARRVASFGAR